jgi:hypothetical protein
VPFGVVGDVVGFGDRQAGFDGGVNFRSQRVPHPAHVYLPDTGDTGNARNRRPNLVDQARFNRVE